MANFKESEVTKKIKEAVMKSVQKFHHFRTSSEVGGRNVDIKCIFWSKWWFR